MEPEPPGAAFFCLEPVPTQVGRSRSWLRDLGDPEPEPPATLVFLVVEQYRSEKHCLELQRGPSPCEGYLTIHYVDAIFFFFVEHTQIKVNTGHGFASILQMTLYREKSTFPTNVDLNSVVFRNIFSSPPPSQFISWIFISHHR